MNQIMMEPHEGENFIGISGLVPRKTNEQTWKPNMLGI